MNRTNSTKGFTFIELTVVALIIGLMMALTIPRFRYAILTDNLKSTARKMTGMLGSLRNAAIQEQKAFVLHLDLESNLFWIDSAGMTEEEQAFARENASSLPAGVRVLDVWFDGKGKKMTGEAAIRFSKKGYVRRSVIHLSSEDGREFTLVLSPFLHKVKVMEKYVEFEGY